MNTPFDFLKGFMDVAALCAALDDEAEEDEFVDEIVSLAIEVPESRQEMVLEAFRAVVVLATFRHPRGSGRAGGAGAVFGLCRSVRQDDGREGPHHGRHHGRRGQVVRGCCRLPGDARQ